VRVDLAAGSRSTVNVVDYDFLPTFADLAAATSRQGPNIGGVSFKHFLLGGSPTEEEAKHPRMQTSGAFVSSTPFSRGRSIYATPIVHITMVLARLVFALAKTCDRRG
jgi:hypothetical protein